MELLKIYNDHIDESKNQNSQEEKANPVSQGPIAEKYQENVDPDKITVETLMNQLNEKDRMLQDFKQNTEYYGKFPLFSLFSYF